MDKKKFLVLFYDFWQDNKAKYRLEEIERPQGLFSTFLRRTGEYVPDFKISPQVRKLIRKGDKREFNRFMETAVDTDLEVPYAKKQGVKNGKEREVN